MLLTHVLIILETSLCPILYKGSYGCVVKYKKKKKNKESKEKHCRASHFVQSISLSEFILEVLEG